MTQQQLVSNAPQDFAVFILTNGRPDRVFTYDSLRRTGYTGPVYLLVDDLDKTRDQYVAKYGDQVVVFDKRAIAATFDQGDNFQDMRAIIYARNAAFQVAKQLGVRYFIQLDDDYQAFQYRFNDRYEFEYKMIRNLDRVFGALLRFFIDSGADSVAMAQGGDFIGGAAAPIAQAIRLKRKCMNSFICSTDRPFQFVGRINEDVNTYTHVASKGRLFFTVCQVSLVQKQTQTNAGGMTELYMDSGTYVKSFYSVMYQPSSVKIGVIRDGSGGNGGRIHHQVSWRTTVPVILRESVKKGPRRAS
jgi:hypothetical protein